MKKLLYVCLCLWVGIPCALAQQEITQELQQKSIQYAALSDKIWQWPNRDI
jgi:hypothetical protein